MKSSDYDKKVGEVVRVEWNQETGSVYLVLDIIDPSFRMKVLHDNDYQDIIVISGKDVMMVASKKDSNKE